MILILLLLCAQRPGRELSAEYLDGEELKQVGRDDLAHTVAILALGLEGPVELAELACVRARTKRKVLVVHLAHVAQLAAAIISPFIRAVAITTPATA
eukprot:CAMPEP_0119536876 /NCGR_PEP_ID=MMETSP1344-20130328/49659_1 /TAXON_ID=236787 /ORGANISM="Florenciella parvula, Strain CCMP2471" /LENGTH=97 /DNA_ID=CAMNT_0007579155 /DNA_START=79 /DNA_END=368 /DNA_ORIENTATION=+